MAFTASKPLITGETLETLGAALKEAGQPAFRARQVMDWVYRKRVGDWSEMTNLPKDLRSWLDETYLLRPLRKVIKKRSSDVTSKFLFQLEDGSLIETVLINAPQEGVGMESSRQTVCVSIQVGCAYGCKFCASGLAGFKRNLLAGEVIAQFLEMCEDQKGLVEKADPDRPLFDNIVFMGMGEPLANYPTLIRALTILRSEWGFNFGARRITVSTSGLVPEIGRLADEGLGVRLAVSLHGATNPVREQIMPINRKYPLEMLVPAIEAYSSKNGRMVTLEYILIEEINDSLEQAEALAEIARRLHAHVNCIPYNTVQGLPWKRPSLTRQKVFVDVLRRQQVSVTIRREKGHDINAACGQLRLQTEKVA
jgi:23S rRNA (adenine2503-C2)-methyltransferase